ncbi:MAG TPA: BatA domain-containing protein [Cyclobacteriaceae bacterium]|nr:BatA domain-containing protein [Cyclobacteriaceae bacterium]
MNFVNPGFLWALFALSIPILIHLFNFRRTRQVYFSNTRVLKQVKQVSTTRRKLKHYLILLSRLLFIFFLVIVFAQPIIPPKEQVGSQRHVTLYLDNSLSMSAQLADKTRAFNTGVDFLEGIINLFPTETQYRLITNDFSPFSNTFKTKAEALDLLTQIKLSPISRDASEIVTKISDTRIIGDVFWISDFQQSTFDDVSAADSTIAWHLVPITPTLSDNVFIDTAYLDNPFAVGREKNSLIVKVRNDGRSARDQLSMKLTINNIQAATVAINIPAGGIAETSFDLTQVFTGLNKAHLSFNDFPISFDNDFFLALNFSEKINVLEIRADQSRSPVEQVFGNHQLFNYSGFPVGNFNYSLLSQVDLVIVNGIDAIDPALGLVLREYVNNYGTLLLIPGAKPDASSYQSLTSLPISVVDQPIKQDLDPPDFSNPFFENVFEEKTTSLAMPSARKIIDWGADRSSILKFRNGQPFLSLSTSGGKIYIMGSPLTDSFTDFYRNALFVPVMYRIAASAQKNTPKPYYTLSESALSLKIDSLVGEEPLRLIGEQEIIPSQHKIADRVVLDIPKHILNQGFYNVVVNRDTVDLLAFNLDKDESLMQLYSIDQIRERFGGRPNITVFEARSSDAFSNEIKERYLGKPLWKYALMLALFFLLAEILLIRFLK